MIHWGLKHPGNSSIPGFYPSQFKPMLMHRQKERIQQFYIQTSWNRLPPIRGTFSNIGSCNSSLPSTKPLTSVYFSFWPSFSPSLWIHDDIIKWKQYLRYWPFMRGIHRHRWIPLTKASDADHCYFLWSGRRFKNTNELFKLRALKFSLVNKIYIFQCMGKIFCVEFQREQHWNLKSS